MKSNIEKLSYTFLTIGFSLDHVTTYIGLNICGIFESNYIVSSLMKFGLWFYIDSLLCLSLIYITRLFIKKYIEYKFIICFPLISGLIRLLAGFINLTLII